MGLGLGLWFDVDSSTNSSAAELVPSPVLMEDEQPASLLSPLPPVPPPKKLCSPFCHLGTGQSFREFPPPPAFPFLLDEVDAGLLTGAKFFLGALATTAVQGQLNEKIQQQSQYLPFLEAALPTPALVLTMVTETLGLAS